MRAASRGGCELVFETSLGDGDAQSGKIAEVGLVQVPSHRRNGVQDTSPRRLQLGQPVPEPLDPFVVIPGGAKQDQIARRVALDGTPRQYGYLGAPGFQGLPQDVIARRGIGEAVASGEGRCGNSAVGCGVLVMAFVATHVLYDNPATAPRGDRGISRGGRGNNITWVR
jgi:hypothetical protein